MTIALQFGLVKKHHIYVNKIKKSLTVKFTNIYSTGHSQ